METASTNQIGTRRNSVGRSSPPPLQRARPITWLTTLSLDAPLVTLVWQEFLAGLVGFELGWHHRILIFASVWLGYTADRWLDTWRLSKLPTTRHKFHRNSRWPLLVMWLVVLGAALGYAFATLNAAELRQGFLLAAASIAMTIVIQRDGFAKYRNLVKSLLTALLVSASIALFSSANGMLSADGYLALLMPTGLFFTNCLLIHQWDQEAYAEKAHKTSKRDRTATASLAFVFVISLLCWALTEAEIYECLAIAVIISAGFSGVLHRTRRMIDIEIRRTLADIALLTPLGVMMF